MPHTNTDSPIYGFDVIEINGNFTGMFLDVTPTVGNRTVSIPQVGTPRPLPDWAHFFSDQFVCSTPSADDIHAGVTVLQDYISILPGNKANSVLAQQHYVECQRANPQTFRMLQSNIGKERAHDFVHNLLFPDVI